MLHLLRDCSFCRMSEERLFTDSWTGMELCGACMYVIIRDVTLSPSDEGDNLLQLLEARADWVLSD